MSKWNFDNIVGELVIKNPKLVYRRKIKSSNNHQCMISFPIEYLGQDVYIIICDSLSQKSSGSAKG